MAKIVFIAALAIVIVLRARAATDLVRILALFGAVFALVGIALT
jgi:hypothetical protein